LYSHHQTGNKTTFSTSHKKSETDNTAKNLDDISKARIMPHEFDIVEVDKSRSTQKSH